MTRRLGKWLRLLVGLGIVAAAAGLTLQRYALPWYVRRQIIAVAANLNLPITSLAVRDVGLDGTELTDILVGAKDQALRVGRVRVNYTPQTLTHGALTYTVVDGLELPVTLQGRSLDLGFLGHLKAGHPAPAAAPNSELPFQQVWLRSCTIVLGRDPLGVAIPAHLHISNQGAGRIGFDAWVQAPSGWVHALGWYDSRGGDYDFYLDADQATLTPLLDLLPAEVLNLPGRGGGTATFTARLTRTAGAAGGDLKLEGTNFWFRGSAGSTAIQLSDGAINLTTHLGPDYLPQSLTGQVRVGKVLLANRTLKNLDLQLALTPGSRELHFQAGGDLMAIHAGVTQGVLRGLLPPSPDGALALDAALLVAGPIPPELASWLHSRGISLTAGGAWSAQASIHAALPAADTTGARPWRVDLPEARITLGKTDVTLDHPAVNLRGIEGELHGSGSAGAQGVTLNVVPGQLLALGDLTLPANVVQCVRSAAVPSLLTLNLDAPATVRGRFWGAHPDGTIEFPAVTLRIPGAHVTAWGGALEVPLLRGQLALQARGGLDGAQLAFAPGTKIDLPEIRLDWKGQKATARGVTLAPPLAEHSEPLLAVVRHAGAWQPEIVRVPVTISADRVDGWFAGGVTVGAANTACDATLGLKTGAPTLRARLTCPDAQVSHPATGLRLTGIRAAIPVTWNCDPQPAGSYAIAQVGLGANRLPGITGSIGIAGTRIDATLDWPLLPPQALRGSAWFDAAPGTAENPAGPHGAFQAQLPATTIDDPNKLASLLAPFHGITFTGTLAAKINLAFSAAVLVPLIHADLSDATLAMPQRGIGLEGVRGSLTINSLSPLASPGDQRLDIAKVRFNKFVVADNTLAYRIEDAHSLFLERYQGSWAGGHLYTYALRLDPAHPVLDATLFFDNLQLDQMLATVAPDYASGQGRLYGRLPVRVAWPHVTLGSGFLYAAPGGGTLRVQQAQDLAPAVDQSNLANVKQSLLAALKDYQFDILSVDLIQDQRGLVASIVTTGRGRAGPIPIEVKRLTVNLIGVDSLLEVFLGLNGLINSSAPSTAPTKEPLP